MTTEPAPSPSDGAGSLPPRRRPAEAPRTLPEGGSPRRGPASRGRLPALLGLLAAALPAREAAAIPGPATTVVVANARLPESVALARRYQAVRAVPDAQVCLLVLPDRETVDLATFQGELLDPLLACLAEGDLLDRVEAILLVRGVPLRVSLPDRGEGAQRASLAAVLGVARSRTMDGASLLERSPGRRAMCGSTPCLAARWPNPFRAGRFSAGYEAEQDGIRHRPWLVTMLHGRSYADAARLVESATTAEAEPGGRRILLMRGSDPARGVLDGEYFSVGFALERLGFAPEEVPFDRNRTGEVLAGFVTGTARLESTIEGNQFEPGAVVDNLTSLGAVPVNFRASGEERQVSIARWVAAGVAGAHGATDEPLNNCFPSRRFLIDWAFGLTLAEAYHRNLPFVYWRNLVLGDPMAAAWAERPEVRLTGVEAGETVEGSAWIEAGAAPAEQVVELTLYADGRPVAASDGPTLRACLDVSPAAIAEGAVALLAVAETRDGRTAAAKGWTTRRVGAAPGPPGCPPDGPDPGADGGLDGGVGDLGAADAGRMDAGAADAAGADLGPPDARPGPGGLDDGGGCRCGQLPRRGRGAAGASLLLAVLVLAGARRREDPQEPGPKRGRRRAAPDRTPPDRRRSS